MMTRRVVSFLLGAGIFGAFTWTPAFAQSEWLPNDATPVQKQFVDEFGATLFDYWNPRLNEYKRTIDRMLSPTDLEELNALRVRWSILIADVSTDMKARADVSSHDEESDVKMKFGSDDEGKFTEIFEIWSRTMALAQGYRSGLDNLSETVLDDAADFGDKVNAFVNDFTDANRAALSGDEKGAELLSHRQNLIEGVGKFKTTLRERRGSVTEVYGFVVEPIVLLFNGGDMRDMLPLTLGNTSGINTQAVAGLLPVGAVLQQNVPNPAATRTRIDFTLPEASSATTLRIYSADGTMVRSVDLGALPAGARSHELEVSDLANGSYLYHLTVTTTSGEMVYSKVMQVVR